MEWGFCSFAAYFIRENYLAQPVKLMGIADVTNTIDKPSLNHMFLISYPETEVYDTRDKDKVQEELEILLNMDVRKVKNVKETKNHYKLTFENKEGDRMQLLLYENGTGTLKSNHRGLIGTTVHLETVDETFTEHFLPLLPKTN
ncbi:hypothetical protein [Ureibacillus aquaedulcis]|uniref:Uncharacterized protein n=1 Tax=Ureibacillus aquaedulcis TaxID=3058421 RepID=A0ABT8GTL0_9BACL|nr:hypothetical protein [Ureibacillus sp. BA0131]MDN4494750.1 hypothetical protein [Ureibacillus sp. BA0131]